jgi:ATP-dependent exoDNAse (exonuclease V) beta subunit
MGEMVNATDTTARQRFVSELDRNFSVVASAGSGKGATTFGLDGSRTS